MVKKKKKTWKLVVSLIFMSIVLAVSVGGLSFIGGANANEGVDNSATSLDVVEKSEIGIYDYVADNFDNGGSRELVALATVEEAIAATNNYLKNAAYVVTSTGRMNVSGTINGIIKEQNICDLSYRDYFEHEVGGRTYWEEGFKVGNFYNSTLEGLFNTFISATNYQMQQLTRFYFINEDIHFSQWLDKPNFSSGFNADPNAMKNTQIVKYSNTDKLRTNSYMDRYFRWDINANSVKNGAVSKTISGYQFEFDLDVEKGARDVYRRWIRWLPQNVVSKSYPGSYHYVLTFDRYGNIISFNRNEVINLEISSVVTGKIQLNFALKYSFKRKSDNFKASLDDVFKTALSNAGY